MKNTPGHREDYGWWLPLGTRWHDNDLYGHVNNVTYYSFFDTIANQFLIRQCGLDIQQGGVIGLVVSSRCDYHASVAFPDALEGALRVDRLGTSSVQWGLAVFRQGAPRPAAEGQLVHVFVDRTRHRPVPIPHAFRAAMTPLLGHRA